MLAFFWLVIVLLFVALPLVRGPGRDGYLHFRDDLPRFEQALLELDEELSRVEQALTHERGLAYR